MHSDHKHKHHSSIPNANAPASESIDGNINTNNGIGGNIDVDDGDINIDMDMDIGISIDTDTNSGNRHKHRTDFISVSSLVRSPYVHNTTAEVVFPTLIQHLFSKAVDFKFLNNQTVKKLPNLRGRTVVNLFLEKSIRTLVSFEAAAKRLDADVINFSPSSASRSEGLFDTIATLDAMGVDLYCIRHANSGAVQQIAERTSAHVVNAGDGFNGHPTQAILDAYTISEHITNLKTSNSITNIEKFKGLRVSIIGNIANSRVAKSNIELLSSLGCDITIFGPNTLLPKYNLHGVKIARTVASALEGADVVMMLRVQLDSVDANAKGNMCIPSAEEYNRFYGLNSSNLHMLGDNTIIMHPGPINRGLEMDDHAIAHTKSRIFDQVSNGVALRMAIMDYLLNETR